MGEEFLEGMKGGRKEGDRREYGGRCGGSEGKKGRE